MHQDFDAVGTLVGKEVGRVGVGCAKDGYNPRQCTVHPGARVALSPSPANPPGFIPVKLGAVVHEPKPPELKVELRKGALSMSITWPMSCTGATADFVQWSRALLQ